MHTGMILIDLQKAFDILDHKVFQEKMAYPGFKTPIFKWLESYLSNKKFFVYVDDFFSEAGILNWILPQESILGSLLGQLLFPIYINDLLQSISESGFYPYAYNTCAFFQNIDVNKIEDALNKEFSKLCDWSVNKRLLIHFWKDKAKCILFSKIKRSWKLNPMEIMLLNSTIQWNIYCVTLTII